MSETLKPILKWAGGKRQLIDVIRPLFPNDINCYYEPFLGAGALFFDLMPKKAVINDINEELINMYIIIRDNPIELIKRLKEHSEKHCKEYYYYIRELDRLPSFVSEENKVERAARTIYLNKTCYNGLYRVNGKGQFNTPIGRYVNPNIDNEETIQAMSKFLKNSKIKIKCQSYTEAIKGIRKGDFVYLDPPYQPLTPSSSFTAYTKDGFDFESQMELKSICDGLHKKGVKFLQSNSDNELIRELYKDYNILTVSASRYINSKANNRKNSSEIIINNYEV